MAHGTTPVYDNKIYVWKPCSVLAYDINSKKFQVLVISTQQKKWVTRLSLLFYKENKAKFDLRLETCKKQQKEVEDEIRFARFV